MLQHQRQIKGPRTRPSRGIISVVFPIFPRTRACCVRVTALGEIWVMLREELRMYVSLGVNRWRFMVMDEDVISRPFDLGLLRECREDFRCAIEVA